MTQSDFVEVAKLDEVPAGGMKHIELALEREIQQSICILIGPNQRQKKIPKQT
jgi:hypothetical protein